MKASETKLELRKYFTPPSMHYTYVLRRKNNALYIGYTSNLKQRMAQHARLYRCKLIYYEAYQSEKAARDRELRLKYYGSAWRGLLKRMGA